MDRDDIKFTIVNEFGETVECNVITIIPKNNDESFVVFFDGEKEIDGSNIIKYGKLIKNNNDFEIYPGVTNDELEVIKDKMWDEIYNFAEEIIKESNGD